MLKELVVNAAEYETRVALLENGNIVELFIERGDETNIAGSIYKGRIQRVLPGMQAAFVDIGLNQAAFLYVDDILDDTSHDLAKQFEQDMESEGSESQLKEMDDEDESIVWKRTSPPSCRIEDLVTEGQEIMVQVAKSPIGTKGPRVTTHISLPGRFMVIMPTVDHIGISKRIECEKERKRLKELLLSIENNGFGYIFRTAAEGIGEERLQKEISFLCKTWEDIQKKNMKASAPTLLYKDLSVTFRAVRDLLTDEADKLIIDSRAGYQSVQKFLKELMPGLNVSIELYDGAEPIFDVYNIEGDITRALNNKVWLKSGGYIIIEQTEALVAIDVNTGRYVGKHNFDETILKTNLEAVKEIAYQIRLRNIGGIIIIDFIDMKKNLHKEKLMSQLNEALKKDKSQTNVLPLSELGLVEMTRKRIRKNLARTLCEPCFYCGGNGMLLSGKSICHKIYRDLLSESEDMMGNRFTVKVHPEIAPLLHGEEKRLISSLENRIGRTIVVYPEPHYHLEEYHIFETLVK
ncbi:MAG: Rne/Rng family ribonuclease [Thermodesulfobacteriota bacterium]|nr:Rne/Rng family ribonuclease [Thermodesulfobacteriota bacterium]